MNLEDVTPGQTIRFKKFASDRCSITMEVKSIFFCDDHNLALIEGSVVTNSSRGGAVWHRRRSISTDPGYQVEPVAFIKDRVTGYVHDLRAGSVDWS